MAKHMKANLTGQGFLSDESNATTCPVCGAEISYEPKSIDDITWDSYGAIYMHTTCHACSSELSASFDYHDVEVAIDGRFKEG